MSFNIAFLPAFKEAGGENFFMFGEACVLRCEIWNANLPPISVAFYTWKESGNYEWKTDHTAQAALSNEALVAQHFEDNSDTVSQPTSNNAFLNGNDYHKPDRSKSSGMDMIDFYMHHSFINANDTFGVALSEDNFFNDSTYNVMYVDSHDYGPNGGSLNERYVGSQANWAENLDLIFTFRGIPCIYYGSEIEFKKGEKIDDWHNPLEKSGDATFSGIPSGTYVDMVTGDTKQCSGTLTVSCSGQGNMRVYITDRWSTRW